MKNIFAFCKDAQSQTKETFLLRSPSDGSNRLTEQYRGQLKALEKKSTYPLWVNIIKWGALVFFGIILLSALRAGISVAWKNGPALFFIGGGCLILFLVLFLIEMQRKKRGTTREANALRESAERHSEEVRRELGVPANALQTDILSYTFQIRNGKEKRASIRFADYSLLDTLVFYENGMLCIFDWSELYGIPVSEIAAIRQNDKRVSIMGWNKLVRPEDPVFKPYRLFVNGYGNVFVPSCAVTVRHGGEEYEILFPAYEADKICMLCGIPLTANQ